MPLSTLLGASICRIRLTEHLLEIIAIVGTPAFVLAPAFVDLLLALAKLLNLPPVRVLNLLLVTVNRKLKLVPCSVTFIVVARVYLWGEIDGPLARNLWEVAVLVRQ